MIEDGICFKIIDNLYIGNFKTSMSKTLLNKNKITHILSVGYELKQFFKDVIMK